jgi:urease accessory protein
MRSSGGLRDRAMQIIRQDPPWRVVRSFRVGADSCLVHLHNLSGGVLSGDRLQLLVDVGEGANVQLTSTGATRIYRTRTGKPGAQSLTRMNVRKNALLEYIPDQIIPYEDSRFHQEIAIDLDPHDAGLFCWETITPGRTAAGERFAYEKLELRTHLSCDGKLFSLDQFAIEPAQGSPQQTGMLGEFDCCSTFYICRTGVDDRRWVELEGILDQEAERLSVTAMRWGATRLMEHGIMVRGVGLHASQMLASLICFWRIAKMYLYGQHAVIPRKVH